MSERRLPRGFRRAGGGSGRPRPGLRNLGHRGRLAERGEQGNKGERWAARVGVAGQEGPELFGGARPLIWGMRTKRINSSGESKVFRIRASPEPGRCAYHPFHSRLPSPPRSHCIGSVSYARCIISPGVAGRTGCVTREGALKTRPGRALNSYATRGRGAGGFCQADAVTVARSCRNRAAPAGPLIASRQLASATR